MKKFLKKFELQAKSPFSHPFNLPVFPLVLSMLVSLTQHLSCQIWHWVCVFENMTCIHKTGLLHVINGSHASEPQGIFQSSWFLLVQLPSAKPITHTLLLLRPLEYHVLVVYLSSLQRLSSFFLLRASSNLTSKVGILQPSVLSSLLPLVYSSPQNDLFHPLVLNSISMIRIQN